MPSSDNNISWVLKEASKYPPLDQFDELILLTRLVHNEEGVKEKLFNHNLALVIFIANKYRESGLPMNDIIQEGCLGLMHAIKEYPPGARFKFSTHATKWIRNYIFRGINRMSLIKYKSHDLPPPIRRAVLALRDNPYMPIEEITNKAEEIEMISRYLNRYSTEEIDPDENYDETNETPTETIDWIQLIISQDVLIGLNEDELKILAIKYGKTGSRKLMKQYVTLAPKQVKQIELQAFSKIKCFLQEYIPLDPRFLQYQ